MEEIQAYELVRVKEMLGQLHDEFLSERMEPCVESIRFLECALPFIYKELGVTSVSARRCRKYDGDTDYDMCCEHLRLFEDVIVALKESYRLDEDPVLALEAARKKYLRGWDVLV